MIDQNQTTQEGFQILERLAALCATPGIDTDTLKKSNELIQKILDSVVKQAITKISSKSLNIVS